MSLIREIRHGASRPDPHGTRVSWVNRNEADRIGSGQEVSEISRVGSRRLNKFSNLAGRVRSGQEVPKISRVRSGQVETSQNFRGSGRVSPTREV